ncbi:phenylpropionate dioxygenase-like ring-hydroxylating dioxygenase large terminal subunit [Maritimibacter alkaliphilus HTCC2654]|nr:Rieske 2Fe-2S domain-containing protein [Maritimibacter alkaliphilus]TYP80983.1 phenylpropionate dioxygenase-like ring-hydroxylating dioxygenase large terminal subunit [Maritimibacter alkaliphilus HTCC2654]
MLSHEQNEMMCRVGPGTPMGDAFRRYWIPICQTSDIPTPDSPPFPLEILGQKLVVWRNADGQLGVLDQFCPHRRSSLAIGRCEGDGIRCLYHGWKFAPDGTVLETPNVNDPDFKNRFKAEAFPVREAGGLVWSYLGPKLLQPEFPHFPWFDADDDHRNNAYALNHCNYVQALEALVDSSHLNILHADGLVASGQLENLNFSAAAEMTFDAAPTIEVDDTDFGFHYAALRRGENVSGKGEVHVRVTAFSLPCFIANPNEDLFMCVVPINDEQCIHFHVWWHAEREMGKDPLKSNMLKHVGLDPEALANYNMTYETFNDDDRPSLRNRYKQDRSRIQAGSFSGFHSFTQEDSAVNISPGAIKDRSKEILAPVDMAVSRLYRSLISAAQAVENDQEPQGVHADQTKIIGRNGTVPEDEDWRQLVPTHTITRRYRSVKLGRGTPEQVH